MTTVTVHKAKGTADDLLSPKSAAWNDATEASLALEPTPLDSQPSAYVRKAWENRARGDIKSVNVRALAAGDRLYVRLQWAAPDPRLAITDNDVFADACAVAFPSNGKDAEISTLGSPKAPVTLWHWRSGAGPFLATAQGLGTVSRQAVHEVQARGEWQNGQWQVVLSGPAKSPSVRLGVAVWTGAAGERAGIASHTPAWHDVKVG